MSAQVELMRVLVESCPGASQAWMLAIISDPNFSCGAVDPKGATMQVVLARGCISRVTFPPVRLLSRPSNLQVRVTFPPESLCGLDDDMAAGACAALTSNGSLPSQAFARLVLHQPALSTAEFQCVASDFSRICRGKLSADSLSRYEKPH